MRVGFLATILLLSMTACEQPEGEGGKASITGDVMVVDIHPITLDTLSVYEAQEERVYIVYGDNDIYDDDTRTHFDGRYKFDWLFKGDYTVYTYTDCDTCASGKRPLTTKVEITDKNEDVVVPTFYIQNL